MNKFKLKALKYLEEMPCGRKTALEFTRELRRLRTAATAKSTFFKGLKLLAWAFVMSASAINVIASDVFPVFEKTSTNIVVPASIPGCLKDIGHLVGTNYVYQFNGQVFSGDEGHIQTVAEGFNGKTDESTPWKTLTELLAFYQNGGSKQEMTALFDNADTSTDFINKIYGSQQMTENLKTWGRSMVSMQVNMGCDYLNGYLVFVRLDYNNGHHNVLPFFFTVNDGRYKMSAVNDKKPSSMFLNIGLYLNRKLASIQI